jgi:hypothetical protein
MARALLRWLAPLLVAGLCCLPAWAQKARDEISRGVRAGEDVGPGLETNPTGALPYAIAILSVLIVLVIVCMPSRKVQHDT